MILNQRLTSFLLEHSLPGSAIAFFAGFGAEPDLAPTAWECQQRGRSIYLPRILTSIHEGSAMAFYEVKLTYQAFEGEDFITHPFGMVEPAPALDHELTVDDHTVIILPCLGANLKGERLGHGGGYYDRFLHHAREANPITVLPLLSWQVIDSDLPMNPLDQTAQYVIIST